jgi:hypothetical protein
LTTIVFSTVERKRARNNSGAEVNRQHRGARKMGHTAGAVA